MKQGTLALLGLALLSTAACSKKVAVQPPPAPAPQAQAAVEPAKQAPLATRPAPSPAPAPQQTATRSTTMPLEKKIELNQILARMEDALFDYDKAAIRQDATGALRSDVGLIRDLLAAYPSQKVLIEGHCDERGSDEYNLALGDRRAKAAEEFLVTMGVPDNQLTMISLGKSKPVCTEETEACWQRNRRAHLTAAN